jgi:hypothetical protein
MFDVEFGDIAMLPVDDRPVQIGDALRERTGTGIQAQLGAGILLLAMTFRKTAFEKARAGIL